MMRKYPDQIGVGTLKITPRQKRYVNDVLNSNRLSYGKYLSTFESKFAKVHGCRYGLMLNSGTSALRIAVACLRETGNWHRGDEILVPASTFVATANVVLDHGLKPVFVDIDPKTYNIDPAKIEAKITKRTRAIMVVHLYGQPADMDLIMRIAKKYRLKVIEDSCETMFVRYKGRAVGSFGDISCFSTYVAHLLVTGVGGLALTNNSQYAEIMKSFANHGRDGIYLHIDDDAHLSSQGLFKVVERRFRFIRPGYSFRVTEMEGALGLAQLETRHTMMRKRQIVAQYFLKHLKRFDRCIQLPYHPKGVEHAFMLFPIVVKKNAGIKKKDLVFFLEKNNIETRDMMPLINQPFYVKMFGVLEPKYPVAAWVNHCGFYIGCHQGMDAGIRSYIVAKFAEFFRSMAARAR